MDNEKTPIYASSIPPPQQVYYPAPPPPQQQTYSYQVPVVVQQPIVHVAVPPVPPPQPQQPAYMMPVYLVPGPDGQQQLVAVMNAPPSFDQGHRQPLSTIAGGMNNHSYWEDKRKVTAAMICYVLGFFFWVPQIVSISFSLHQSRKGFFKKDNAAIIAFSIIELIAWLVVPSVAWGFDYSCYTQSYWNGYSYSYYTQCYSYYWGWIAFTIWGPLTLAFGIPRIVLSYRQLRRTYYPNGVHNYYHGYN
eukprot:TRINITY_DN96_c0_g2_i1.p1 TRINITY_DN96_c0_g2~~TRINITY_DN96_c0_g2_i1.p1  ORF type:complete len:284 (+),score=59.45 TRINITY_DN96_c0_g2_i1:113-853(+)